MYNGPSQFLLFLVDNGTRLVSAADMTMAGQPRLGYVSAGQTASFLAPPSTRLLQLKTSCCQFLADLADAHADLAWPAGSNQFVSGANVYDLEQYQNDTFPHRTPGQPNYAKSQQYFSKYFTDLGYTVEVDPYGTDGLPCPPVGPCPSAAANIVATKVGTDPDPKIIFVAGGHYDMVPGTTHAAFDNTSGTACTMELARAMAPYKFHDTLKFALFGGEESGTVGSEVWVKTHPDSVAKVLSYWNLDVVGMSWPAPVLKPSPVLIAAGPDVPSQANDGTTVDPVSLSLLDWAKTLQHDWLGYPDAVNGTPVFRYEGVASGQKSGYAGVNAQSDHTAFIDLGIPGYFLFNGDTLHEANPIRIHNNKDTLENMTKVSYYGAGAADLFDSPWPDAAVQEQGKQALERSWEVSMWFPFYHAVLVDQGVYTPPAVAAAAPGLPVAALP
jgi:hypothetical protein